MMQKILATKNTDMYEKKEETDLEKFRTFRGKKRRYK